MSRGYRNRTYHLLMTQKVMSGTWLNRCGKQFLCHEQRTINRDRELLALCLVVKGDHEDLRSLGVRTAGKKRQSMPQDPFSLKNNCLLLFGKGLRSQSSISTLRVMLIIERTIKRILLVHREERISQKLLQIQPFLYK